MDQHSAREELAALMRQVAGGDRGALRKVYDRTSAKLYGICLRLLRDEGDAQDILQEVYVTVWNRAASYDPSRASAVTWLATLTRNRAIDQLRRVRLPTEGPDALGTITDDHPSSLDVLEQAEDVVRLRECLDELDERTSMAIRAAFFDGATYPELARREDVPLSTMKSWIRRGLVRLRGCMER